MNTPNSLDFDFDFDGTERSQFLDELNALYSELGDESQGQTPDDHPASYLFAQLNQEKAKFAEFPDIIQLSESDFTDSGRTVPQKFRELSNDYNFYRIAFPIILWLPPNWYFNKLECKVKFYSELSREVNLQPKAITILPNIKFKEQLKTNGNIETYLGENLEFELTTGAVNLKAGQAQINTNAGGKAKLNSNLGFTVGPFTYSLKTPQIENTGLGSSEVIWRINGAEFFQENSPNLIVVLQVPKSVKQLKIDAVLQAYHRPNLLTSVLHDLDDLIRVFSRKDREFWDKGAPIRDPKTWDISPSL